VESTGRDTFNEQLDMLLVYGEAQKNSIRTQALYAKKYPNRMHYIVYFSGQKLRETEEA